MWRSELWGRVVGAAAWLQSGPHKRPDLLPAATIQRQGLLLMNFQVTQSVKKGARQPHCTVCQPAPCMLAFLGLWLCLMCPCCVGGSCECAEDREDMLHDRRASGECCIGYTGPLGSSCVSSVSSHVPPSIGCQGLAVDTQWWLYKLWAVSVRLSLLVYL